MEEKLINSRVILLALVTAMTGLLAIPSTQLEYDQSIESFYSPSDPVLQSYLASRDAFGGDEFLFVGFPVTDPTSDETLEEIGEFADKLSQVPGIQSESTQDLESTLRNDRASGLLRVAMRLQVVQDSIIQLARRMLISDDDSTTSIILRLQNRDQAPIPRSETFAKVRSLAKDHSEATVVAGEPLQVYDTFRYVEEDAWILGAASSALLMLVILVFFRNLRWVLIPMLLIQITLIWTKGIMSLSGMKLSMVSSILTSLVTIIGIATVMHVTLVYQKFRQELERPEALKKTIERLKAPIIWTCTTTGVGFASLLSSNVVPVRSFAWMMSLATLLVPVVLFLLLPGSVLIGKAQVDPKAPWGEAQTNSFLRMIGRWTKRFGGVICFIAIILSLGLGFGLTRLKVETDFSKNFRDDSRIVEALNFFEQKLGGVGSWEIGFDAPAKLDEEFLDKVRQLTQSLRELKLDDGTQLTKVISITDGLDLVPKVRVSSDRGGGLLPMLPRLRTPTLEEKQQFLDSLQPEMTPSLYRPDLKRMRILLRSLEQKPAEIKLQLIDDVEAITREVFPDATATGLYVLLANLISSLLSDQMLSFFIAVLGIVLTMSFALRSIALGLISLFPNLLPILFVIGAMGWLEIPVNIGTAMIASVSIGLTVDSTIHYLFSYRRHRQAGKSHTEAVMDSHSEVGMAVWLSTIALVLGFSVLMLSNFVPLSDFGILVSGAIVGGMLGNLFLLPVLLGILDRFENPRVIARSSHST